MAGYTESMQQSHYTHPELLHREASHKYFGASHDFNIDTRFDSRMQSTDGLAEDMTLFAVFLKDYYSEVTCCF